MRRALLGLLLVSACRSSESPSAPAPAIDRLEPDFAVPRGGQMIHIRGSNFDPKSPVKVYFGDRASEMAAVLTKDRIQAITPPGTEGVSVEVRIELPGGRHALSPQKFRFETPRDEPVKKPKQ